MSEIQKLSLLSSKPGILRDGTLLDGEMYSDGQWVRFQRGRPKKIGGYSLISDRISGPTRDNIVWSRGDQINIFSFSNSKIEMIQVDNNGSGSSVSDVTPSSDFTGDTDYLWSTDSMYDAAAGSTKSIVLAVPTKTALNIDDLTEHKLIVGAADGSSAFTVISDANGVASGGCFVSAPYAVLYGSDGKVTWSNANEPQNYTTGDAGTARVSGAKIVQGFPIHSGSGAAGLLWTLTELIRMDYIGGQAIFRFSRVGSCSIVAQNSVIEYDGVFYWIGIDRFYVSEGGTVKEIPNNVNLNWLFDNLNYEHRNKIWAMKVPRFGEIWWFYPRGDATECSHAIIYNVREQTWYDCELDRSSGYYSQVFQYPIMCSSNKGTIRSIGYTITTGEFVIGNSIKGSTSGAIGNIVANGSATSFHVKLIGSTEFSVGENFTKISTDADTGTTDVGVVTSTTELYKLFLHERGRNAVDDDQESAIDSYITTADFGLPANQGVNRLTRLVRVEPDFLQEGSVDLSVIGYDYANSQPIEDGPFSFDATTEKIDSRIQKRHILLKFRSNELNGFYEMGKTILWTEPGDVRP
jgi:hypothetical protein